MDRERDLIRNELLNLGVKKLFTSSDAPKNSQLSNEARQDGNDIYTGKGPHKRILNLYSKSVAFAPDATEELALAYGNRSALLLRLKRYNESIVDIDRALDITKSDALEVKLLCRKVECLTALGSPENQSVFEAAADCLLKISDRDKSKENCAFLLKKTKVILDLNKQSLSTDTRKSKFLKTASRKQRAGPFEDIDIGYSKKYGRYLVARRNFEPGEIIFVERPYACASNVEFPYVYCCHCLNVAWTGIPCKSCNWCIFCSEKCRDKAWKKYHDMECSIVPYLKYIKELEDESEKLCMFRVCIRILMMGIKEVGHSIQKLKSELKSIDECRGIINILCLYSFHSSCTFSFMFHAVRLRYIKIYIRNAKVVFIIFR